jgi:hypothetical protein
MSLFKPFDRGTEYEDRELEVMNNWTTFSHNWAFSSLRSDMKSRNIQIPVVGQPAKTSHCQQWCNISTFSLAISVS